MEAAKMASDELDYQNEILDRANDKAEKAAVQIKQINKKLKKTLKEVDKDKYCLYVICCLMLLGIVGVVISQSGVFK